MKWTHPGRGERDLAVSYSPLGYFSESRTVVAVLRDLTNVRQFEELLITSQRRIEMAERAGLPFGLWDWDLKTNRLDWSSEMFRQWGIDRGSFSGRLDDFVGRIHAEDRVAVDEVMRRALARETERFSVQFRIVRPCASIAWVEVQGAVLNARSQRIVGLSLDITELKKVQESLRASKENYLRLLNSAGEGIYAVDLDGNCTFCNAACVQLLGYSSANDLLGKNMHAIMHHTRANGEPYPEEECSIYRPIREGVGSQIAGEVLWRADGTSFPAEMWSYPMNRGEEFLGAVVSFFDMSGRQQPCDDHAKS